ncbi:hypothetical protein NSB25_26630 [Acetatifactor muris]|uniref:Transcription elongation factor GreA n=1 Tax=Acetatifactor muris TaxID=879566 RepID=A0A2K4ZPB2_9FIRM|nr:hypothetical protein [Acetatifactor muris]MCR2050810.1 hypothetical protein [Acetatifactor muris]SOY32324.1 transcription elongation factor GreA [Acetatifactor muris]
MEEYRIDPELNEVLPELSNADYKALEQSLLTEGYKGAPIMVWGDIIVDGHNRYEICNKHNIPYEVKSVEFESKEEAIIWMVRQQLGRRSLTTLQRIQIVEKYRPFYKKKAKRNKSLNGGNKKSELEKSTTPIPKEEKVDVRAELAKDADVSTNTYSKGVKILESGNKELINETISGQKSINKAFNELKKSADTNKTDNVSDPDGELKDLKEIQRKEAAQKIKEVREKYGIESTEYENAKAEQLNVEVRINEIENTVHDAQTSDIESMLTRIQERYCNYLLMFQQDVEWLLDKEFYRDDEDVSGRMHSDLQNCFEKFKSISEVMGKMVIDEFGCITINK